MVTRFENSLPLVLAVSGFFGAILGVTSATWQMPNEPAQILMGLIPFDHASLVHANHLSNFSLVNYATWAFLAASKSEIASSLLLSALIGSVTLQVVAMLMFLVIRNSFASVIAALAAVRLNVFGQGINYPIVILGSPHAHGRAGLIAALFALLFFALSRPRAGFFFAALAPFIHPGWGVWLNGCLALAFVVRFRDLRALLTRQNLGLYAAVAGSCAAIYLWQKINYPIERGNLTYGRDSVRFLFDNYIRYWDSHRRPHTDTVILLKSFSLAAVTLGWAGIMLRKSVNSAAERLFYWFLVVAGAVSIPLVFIPSWFDPSRFPVFFIAMMPGRFINALIFLAGPVLVAYAAKTGYGLLGSWKHTAAAALIAALVIISPLYVRRHVPQLRKEFTRTLPLGTQSRGVLTTSKHFYLDVESRVPTITPILDYLGYVNSNAAPAFVRQMEEIYGVPLDGRPRTGLFLHHGSIATENYKQLWESRSCTEWAQLGDKYKFDTIVVPADFTLRLPLQGAANESRIFRAACG